MKQVVSQNIGGWLGPFIIGWSLDYVLYGLLIHQFFLWAGNARTERRWVQAVVVWVMLAGSACTAYSIWYVWDNFVLGFGVYGNFADISKFTTYGIFDPITLFPAQVNPPSSGVIQEAEPQLFLVERAYRHWDNAFWVPLFSAPFMAMGMTGAIGAKVAGDVVFDVSSQGVLRGTTLWLYLCVCGNLILDCFLSCTIAWGLKRSQPDWSSSDNLISRLIRFTVETALPGTVVFFVFLPVYAITRTQNSFATAFFVIIHPKVHAVCLYAVLNYRFTLCKALGADTTEHNSTSGPNRTNTFALSNRQQQQTMALDNIKVDTYTYEESHVVPEVHIGINRQRHPDEESGHSVVDTIDTGKDEDGYNSTTLLHQPPGPSGSRTL